MTHAMGPMARNINEDGPTIEPLHDGYSDAVAHRAVPASAAGDLGPDIARGMGESPVNPQQAASAVGRGPIPQKIGESIHHNLGNLQEIADK